MEGPGQIIPSMMMPIYTGNRIGLMDDTGNSLIDHLHFSIHDRQIIYPGAPLGGSVRPTPMNGEALEDDDSGKCICSTNVETFGAPEMIYPTGFAAQNWVITPVATAVGQAQPTRIQDQTWELLLSGVVLIDMRVGLSHRKNGLFSALAFSMNFKARSRISSSTVSIRLG